MLQAVLDYMLSFQASEALGRGERLLTFFAFFYTAMGVASFLLQATITKRALAMLGLASSVAMLPIAVALSLVTRIFMPLLPSAALVRGTEASVRGSLYRAAYELFFTPLAPNERRPTKTLIDVGFDRFGTLVGSGITMACLATPLGVQGTLFVVLILLCSVVSLGLTRALHRGYVDALENSLRSGAVDLREGDVFDKTTRRTLSETVGALDRKQILQEIGAMRRAKDAAARGRPEPVPPVEMSSKAALVSDTLREEAPLSVAGPATLWCAPSSTSARETSTAYAAS